MVAPMVLAAGIGAAGSALGGILGGKGAKKAADEASDTQRQVAQANNALVQWNYGENAARLDPYVAGGTRAGNVLMELLLGPAPTGGGGGGTRPPTTSPQLGGSTGYGAPITIAPNVLAMQNDGIKGNFAKAIQQQYPDLYALNQMGLQNGMSGDFASGVIAAANRPRYNAGTGGGGAAGATSNRTGRPVNALSAWDQFRNSTNYNWRFDQGQEALAQNFAGTALDSGAQRIAELEYGQQFASNELGNWMNMLAGQQGIGLQAGSALAGVGTAGTNAMMANNQNAANAQSNAALMAGQANQNMWGGLAQGIGQVAGAWGSSYGREGGPGRRDYGYAAPDPSQIYTNYNNPAWGGGSAWGY